MVDQSELAIATSQTQNPIPFLTGLTQANPETGFFRQCLLITLTLFLYFL